VVGHIEWVQFARVPHTPRAGEVVHAQDAFEEPAGGGAVAAVQLARLAGEALLFTALGRDEIGERSLQRLRDLDVRVHAVRRDEPTRRAVTLVDDAGERTIVTFGARLEARGEDAVLPWEELAAMDGVYFTAGDHAALLAARRAAVVVASPRARHALGHGVRLDALVLSADDAIERAAAERARGEAQWEVLTEGEHGGTFAQRGGEPVRFEHAPLQADADDSYGSGDAFAAGLTFGLAAGMEFADALALAARCGAACATGRGPYERQLTLASA